MKREYMYIVWWKQENVTCMGFLPFSEVVKYGGKNNILMKALLSGDLLEQSDNGIHGVHWNKKLASEHMRIEKKWRKSPDRIIWGITRI